MVCDQRFGMFIMPPEKMLGGGGKCELDQFFNSCPFRFETSERRNLLLASKWRLQLCKHSIIRQFLTVGKEELTVTFDLLCSIPESLTKAVKMRVVGLISGGKDSVYNMLQCIVAGHEIVAVANIEPAVEKEEMDSYMYQSVGHHTLSLLSAAMSIPIYRQRTKGIAKCKEKVYVETPGDEVEDLFALLSKVKDEMHIDGVSVGAVESDYQRTRVENVCLRLNLKCFAFLWKRDQEELLQEMIDADINAIVVKVAAIGLKPESHLGMSIRDMQPVLLKLNKKFGVHICGEGGEYETLTIDCPLYHRKINIIESEKIIHSDDAFAPVAYLIVKKAILETKSWEGGTSQPSEQEIINYMKSKVKPPLYYIQDCLDKHINEIEIFGENPSRRSTTSSEVLPFPFDSSTKVLDVTHDTKATSSKHAKDKPSAFVGPVAPADRTVKFSPSSVLNIDTSVTHLNLSTGWCSVGNIVAPSIKDGLSLVQKHLERYQYELRNIVSITLYVRDMGEWPKMNKTYSQFLPTTCPPTRACVAVPLPHDAAVAISVVAHRLVSKTQKVVHFTENTVDREYIHVQSISHWAPANIGPYSQCIRVGEIVYVAGQIPLIPSTMELLDGPILHQCRLTLRHVYRILKAANESYTMGNVMHGICFVVSERIAAEAWNMWSHLTKNEHAAIATVVVSALPKNAQLEWQVVACGYDGPQVTATSEIISGELLINYKRCLYEDHNTSSLVCDVAILKQSSVKVSDKSIRSMTPDNLLSIMKHCLQILRGDIVRSGTPLCMFNVFYKASETRVVYAVSETMKTSLDFKVVITCIPVLACKDPNVILTISGVCH